MPYQRRALRQHREVKVLLGKAFHYSPKARGNYLYQKFDVRVTVHH